LPARAPDPTELLEQIRANWAFEHLLASVLVGAGVAGALAFLIGVGAGLIANSTIFAAAAAAFAKALKIAFLVFLIGFLSGVLVIAPLFRMLERAKRRSGWPYVVAALAIAIAGLALVSNLRGADIGFDVAAPVIASSLVISVLFSRRMRPMWRAAAKAEAEDAADPKRLQ